MIFYGKYNQKKWHINYQLEASPNSIFPQIYSDTVHVMFLFCPMSKVHGEFISAYETGAHPASRILGSVILLPKSTMAGNIILLNDCSSLCMCVCVCQLVGFGSLSHGLLQ